MVSPILPKNELENSNFCPSLLRQKMFVRFLGGLKKPKCPFEINWPLLRQSVVLYRALLLTTLESIYNMVFTICTNWLIIWISRKLLALITDILLILPMNKVNYFLCISWCWLVFLAIALSKIPHDEKSKPGKISKF